MQNAPLCQFLTQEDRIESWIQSVLIDGEVEDGEIVEGIVAKYKQEATIREVSPVRNIHTHCLLSYMLSAKDSVAPVVQPSYTYMEGYLLYVEFFNIV